MTFITQNNASEAAIEMKEDGIRDYRVFQRFENVVVTEKPTNLKYKYRLFPTYAQNNALVFKAVEDGEITAQEGIWIMKCWKNYTNKVSITLTEEKRHLNAARASARAANKLTRRRTHKVV